MLRTHHDIIKDGGGAHAVAAKVHAVTGGELPTVQSRVRGWALQKSIPGEYWQLISELGLATLDELAAAAEARRLAKPSQKAAA